MELKNTTKKNFVQLFLYLHSKIDFEEFENNNWMPIYYKAMEWYNTFVSTGRYVVLDDSDQDALMSLQSGEKTIQEISNITGMSIPKLRQKMYKLVSRGLVISYVEEKASTKRNTYYKLAPLGREELLNQIL